MRARSPTKKPSTRAKPAVLRELHGGNKTDHRAADEIVTIDGVGDLWKPPPWFDAEQAEQWVYGVEHSPPGLLTGSDHETLMAWSLAAVELKRAHLAIRQHGMFITTDEKKGRGILNPAYRVIASQSAILMRTGAELGFSPAARAMLGRRTPLDPDVPSGPRQMRGSSSLAAYLEAKPDKLDS
jgi:P27 family predicted phage terminase small subunit